MMVVIWTEDDKTRSNIAHVLKVKLRGIADGQMCKRKRRVKLDKQVLGVKDKDHILKWGILGEEFERRTTEC